MNRTYRRLTVSLMVGDTELNVSAEPHYAELQEYSKLASRIAQTALGIAADEGAIDLSGARDILDFGAGMGGPTFALTRLAAITGGSVDAVEKRPEYKKPITLNAQLPEPHVFIGDGFNYLQSSRAAGRYDLITAFMFGPDYHGKVAPYFLSAVPAALKPGGRLLMTSDFGTMKFARQACVSAGIDFRFFEAIPSGWTYPPDMIVARFDRQQAEAGRGLADISELLQAAKRQQPKR